MHHQDSKPGKLQCKFMPLTLCAPRGNCVGSAARHFSGARNSANSGEGLINNYARARAHTI